jgi:hypothetical protein
MFSSCASKTYLISRVLVTPVSSVAAKGGRSPLFVRTARHCCAMNWYSFRNVLTRVPLVPGPSCCSLFRDSYGSVYVTVTANTWFPSSLRSCRTIHCSDFPGSSDEPNSVWSASALITVVKSSGTVRDGVTISAEMCTEVTTFPPSGRGSSSLLAQSVQEKFSPT